MKNIDKEMFDAFPLRFELREGFPSSPLCPYGNPYRKIGFDIEAQEYVRFTKGVMKADGLNKNRFDNNLTTVGFGGGCHWCTEAVFKSLKGVSDVYQGWISSTGLASEYNEAVLLNFDDKIISLNELIEIHLNTHASSSEHSMREKYRSAVYFMDESQGKAVFGLIDKLQTKHDSLLVTKILPFNKFKLNKEPQLEYYEKNKGNQFCERYIEPKLEYLQTEFSSQV